jgi:serine protease
VSRALRKALSAASCAAAVTLVLASCSDPLRPAAEPEGLSLSKSASAQDDDAVVPGEILVSFKEGVDAAAKIRARGLVRKALGYGGSFTIVSVNQGQERALANVFKNDPDVEWAEPNYIRTVDAIDSRLWAFYNPGGLNMNFSDPADSRYGTPIPSTYASKSDADEDAIEGIVTSGGAVVIGNIDTAWISTIPSSPAGCSPAATGTARPPRATAAARAATTRPTTRPTRATARTPLAPWAVRQWASRV